MPSAKDGAVRSHSPTRFCQKLGGLGKHVAGIGLLSWPDSGWDDKAMVGFDTWNPPTPGRVRLMSRFRSTMWRPRSPKFPLGSNTLVLNLPDGGCILPKFGPYHRTTLQARLSCDASSMQSFAGLLHLFAEHLPYRESEDVVFQRSPTFRTHASSRPGASQGSRTPLRSAGGRHSRESPGSSSRTRSPAVVRCSTTTRAP